MDHPNIQQLISRVTQENITHVSKPNHETANDTYLVRVEDGSKYAIRILWYQTKTSAEVEYNIQQHLSKEQFEVPQYIPIENGSVVGTHGKVFFTISRYIEGLHPRQLSLTLVSSMAETIAIIHNRVVGLSIPVFETQWLHPENIERDIERCLDPFKNRLRALQPHAQLPESLPQAIVHGDIFTDNIYAENDKVTAVFDFETAQFGYRILDLARTYLSVAAIANFSHNDIANALFTGYNTQTHQPITPEERASFFHALCYASVACSAWFFVHEHHEWADKFITIGERAAQGTSGASSH